MTHEAGDLWAFYSPSFVGRVIRCVTGGGPSHVAGIVPQFSETGLVGNGRYWLAESTSLEKTYCELQGRVVKGLQVHQPERKRAWSDGEIWRYRLAPIWRLKAKETIELTAWIAESIRRGVRYDMRGALLSGTRLIKYSRFVPYPDKETVFCSELWAALLQRLGRLPLGNPEIYHPGALLNTLQRIGVYEKPERIR